MAKMQHHPRTATDIPPFASEAEEAEYWANAETSELVETLEEVEHRPARRALTTISVRLRDDDIARLAAFAAARGIGPTQLIREWVLERLADEETVDDDAAVRRVYEMLERQAEVMRAAVAELRRREESATGELRA